MNQLIHYSSPKIKILSSFVNPTLSHWRPLYFFPDYGSQWLQSTFWLPTIFKLCSFMFNSWKKFILGWTIPWRCERYARWHLSDTAQNKRLALIVSISSYSEVHLLGVGVTLESLCNAQDGIRGSHLYLSPPWAEKKREYSFKLSIECKYAAPVT